jgi:hypothetical protein
MTTKSGWRWNSFWADREHLGTRYTQYNTVSTTTTNSVAIFLAVRLTFLPQKEKKSLDLPFFPRAFFELNER